MRLLLLGMTLTCALLALPQAASAQRGRRHPSSHPQQSEGPRLSRAEQRQYRRTIRQALGELEAGRFEEARALFRQAHAIDPSARTFRGIGLVSFELRDYVRAEAALSEALASTRHPLTRELRASTEEVLLQTRAFLGQYRFVRVPSTAVLTVDNAVPPVRPDGTVLLPIGDHVVRARAEGYPIWVRRITVAGGENETVHVTLQHQRERPEEGGGEPSLELASWVLLASGGAMLAAMLGGVGWLVDRDGEVSRCDGVSPAQECLNREVLASEQSAALGFTVAMGVTAALAAGAGLALLLLELDHGERGEAAFACAPGWMELGCVGQF